MALTIVYLSRARGSISRARAILVYHDGGHGHSIIGCDALRRMYPGQPVVFVWFLEHGRHNPHIGQLWKDVDVVLQPFFRFRLLSVRTGWSGLSQKKWLASIYRRVSSLWGPSAKVWSLDEFWVALPSAGPREMMFWKERDYFSLCAKVPAPPARLPASERERLANKVRDKIGHRPLCCVYLRYRETGSVDADSRSGASLDSIFPAFERLVSGGWAVLLTGDRELPMDTARRFQGVVLDAAMINEHRDLFQLYAQTEAAFFIGESGGGVWLPVINQMPTLLINSFPLGWSTPGSTVLWKVLEAPDGATVAGPHAFATFWNRHDVSPMRIRPNSPQELEAAVLDALDWLDARRPICATELFDELPDGALLKTISVRPSPAWPALGAKEMSGSPC